MDGTLDGRTVNGLKRAVSRLSTSKVDLADATLLRNYLKLVVVAQQLAPSAMQNLSAEDMHSCVATMAAEGAALPPHVKSELVVQKISELMEKGAHEEMMRIISPWEQGEFDYLDPRLGCLGDAMEHKLRIFQKLIFNDIIIAKLLLGAQAAPSLLTFAQLCLTSFSDVDMLELDDLAASALNSALDVWRFLVAVLTPTLDTAYLAFRCLKKLAATKCRFGQQWSACSVGAQGQQ
jgi:hypothetical protein